MGYLYAALWFMTAIILFVRFRKESAVVYILSVYFAFAGAWWLVDQLVEADMLNGLYGWILRIVSIVMLIAVGVVYAIEKNLKEKQSPSMTDQQQAVDSVMTEEPVSTQ